MTLYEILGVGKDATEKQIKSAFRAKAKLHHPDKNLGDADAERRFKDVQEAFDVLSDPSNRAEYDKFGTVGRRRPNSATSKPPPGPFENIWEEFFGGSTDKGRNAQVRIEVDLKEILTGVTKQFKVQMKARCPKCEGRGYTEWQPCPKCSGSGRSFYKQSPFNIFVSCQDCRGTGRSGTVKCVDCLGTSFTPVGEKSLEVQIPIGAETGMQIRIAGEGEPGRNGARPGDLYVVVVVREHKLFRRQGKDLWLDVPVAYSELVLGTEFTFKNLDEKKVTFVVPPGTQSGTEFRLHGLGLPDREMHFGNRALGDLVVVTKIEVPKDVSGDYKTTLDQLFVVEKKLFAEKRCKFAE